MPVYQDKKTKKWYFSISKPDEHGIKRRYLKRGFISKNEAKNAEIEFLMSKNSTSLLLFERIVKEFIATKQLELSKSTFVSYKRTIQKYIAPHFKGMRMCNIRHIDIVNWKNQIFKKGLAYNTRHRMFILLNGLFRYAYLVYDIKNPCSTVGNFKNDEIMQEKSVVSIEDFNKFLSVLENKKHKLFFLFVLLTGLRKGEALALQWKDIIDKDKIFINKSYGKYGISTTKTRRSIRHIYLSESFYKVLMEYYENHDKKNPNNYVFGGVCPLSNTNADHIKNKAIKEAKIPYFRIHELRHTYISYMMEKTNDVSSIANAVGHSKEILFETYLHTISNPQKKLTAQIENDAKMVELINKINT